ncbi:hypothetical protein PCANC_23885 [Puccinia coronata f. sp. avenae]|uniref:Uncharacterized protein n=1 Tax=Puccinia coronata f. sp. avenae TaxID=200324 RepID=A0A2N5TZ98_9BASI|nr:hypothetical protein PCANC_23885 [Puccinia coronata f. sp. avenae]
MTVWLPDAKVSERIRQVEQFLELDATFGYDEVEVLVGRLNHVAYLFPQMKCNISSSYQWLKSWVDKHAKRPAPQDVTKDMQVDPIPPETWLEAPVYSPKNPPEDPLTDAISQGPQGLPRPETNQTVKADSSSRWKHWPRFFRDQRFQQLEPLVSLAETDSSSCWEHWSQFLRPTAPAAGTIGLTC